MVKLIVVRATQALHLPPHFDLLHVTKIVIAEQPKTCQILVRDQP